MVGAITSRRRIWRRLKSGMKLQMLGNSKAFAQELRSGRNAFPSQKATPTLALGIVRLNYRSDRSDESERMGKPLYELWERIEAETTAEGPERSELLPVIKRMSACNHENLHLI